MFSVMRYSQRFSQQHPLWFIYLTKIINRKFFHDLLQKSNGFIGRIAQFFLFSLISFWNIFQLLRFFSIVIHTYSSIFNVAAVTLSHPTFGLLLKLFLNVIISTICNILYNNTIYCSILLPIVVTSAPSINKCSKFFIL